MAALPQALSTGDTDLSSADVHEEEDVVADTGVSPGPERGGIRRTWDSPEGVGRESDSSAKEGGAVVMIVGRSFLDRRGAEKGLDMTSSPDPPDPSI